MALSEELEQSFAQEMDRFEEERKMPFVAPFEQLAIKRGMLRKGRENILVVLETRFGEASAVLRDALDRVDEVPRLDSLHRLALTAPSLQELAKELDASA